MKNPPGPIRNNENIPINNQNNNRNYQSFPEYDNVSNRSQDKGFEERLQIGFIKKVYTILTLQLLLVAAACALTMLNKKISIFLRHNKELFWVAFGLSIVILLLLTCFKKIARKVPLNFILLFLFTACEAYIVSYSCAISKPRIVFMAASMTAGMTLLLTIYACVTDTDYTQLGAYLFAFAMALLLMGIFYLFTKNKILYIVMCGLGVFLCSIYIIYDTQLILRNKSNSLSIDDYIIAPLFLFVDIIGLFLNLLGIMNFASE